MMASSALLADNAETFPINSPLSGEFFHPLLHGHHEARKWGFHKGCPPEADGGGMGVSPISLQYPPENGGQGG